jgi:hypothetical protein
VADCCSMEDCAAGLNLYRVFEADCCNLGDCATGRKLYRVLRQIVVIWEIVLQGVGCKGC